MSQSRNRVGNLTLRPHHVCCHGKPEAVSTDPAYLSLFGAGVTDSLAVYTHHHTHEHDIQGNIVGEGECNHP